MDSRAAFEAWISAPPYEGRIYRWPDDPTKYAWPGQYEDNKTQLAWEAWEARDAEIEALRKDAERYQWLRDKDVIDWDEMIFITPLVEHDGLGSDDLLDAVVDAAIAAGRGE